MAIYSKLFILHRFLALTIYNNSYKIKSEKGSVGFIKIQPILNLEFFREFCLIFIPSIYIDPEQLYVIESYFFILDYWGPNTVL